MIKTCSKCGRETTDFVKGYRQCKECIRKYKAKLYQKKKKDYKIYNKKYYKNNKDECLKRIFRYYKKHKDIIINQHRDYIKQHRIKIKKYMHDYQIIYDKKHPGKHAERWRRRRAKQIGVNERFTEEDKQYTKRIFKNKCACCGSSKNLTIDHHKPLEHGHALTRKNAVLLCMYCNCSKGIKYPKEFYSPKILFKIEKILGLE